MVSIYTCLCNWIVRACDWFTQTRYVFPNQVCKCEIGRKSIIFCCFNLVIFVCREEIEKQKAHERYMRLQEQGKTEQAKKDLGNYEN